MGGQVTNRMVHRRLRLVGTLLLSWGLGSGCVVYTQPADSAPQSHRPRKPRRHRPRATPPRPPVAAPAPDPVRPPPSLPPQPPTEAPPASTSRAVLLPPGIGTGRPAGFSPGAEAAYWIWQGPRGSWRIRTTTKNMPHVYRGHVHGMTAAIIRVQPSRTEFRDRVWKTGKGYAFSFKTNGHADGFIFSTRDNGCVRFDLRLDGGPHPKRIHIGKSGHQPPSGHFIVCPKGATPTSGWGR